MKQSTPINALRLAIFFVAAGLASASMSMALSEEKTVMSVDGTLRYGSLTFEEKMGLFKRVEIEAGRKVTDDRNMLSYDKRSLVHNF